MAEIERFRAEAPRQGSVSGQIGDGGASALFQVAEVSSRIASRIGKMADAAAIREGKEAGAQAAMALSMPGVDFAFDQSSPATTPAGHAGGGSGGRVAPENIRQIISAAAARHGVDPETLVQIAGIESSFNPNAKNPNSSAGGLFQFIDSTARQFGLANRYDAYQASDAGARLAASNAAYLRKVLGRDPTGGELYLAHQQGAGGAAKLLRNPNASAVSVVGSAAISLNGGHAGMTAGEFASLWTRKVSGASVPAAPAGIDPVQTAAVAETGTAVASTPAGTGVSVTLTGRAGALPQATPGTLYGDAYNAAAVDIFTSRLDTSMRAQMEALALEHPGDPSGLAAALDAQRAGYLSELPPEAAAMIDQSFQRQKLGLVSQATTQWRNNLEAQDLAAAEENISARTNSAYRLAARAGNSPEADAAIAGELGALEAQIDGSRLNPLQKSRFKADARSGVVSARVLGAFENLKDPTARAEYAKAFQQEWLAGEGLSGSLDAKTYESINGEMLRRVQSDEVAALKRSAALDKSINDQIGYLKKGWPVPEALVKETEAAVLKSGDAAVAKNLQFLQGLTSWQKAHIAARPEVVDAQIAQLDKKIREEGITEAADITRDVMTGLRDQMTKGLKNDPLGWANQAGVAEVEPLDMSGDPARLTASLVERTKDARAVAAHYGVQPRFFTPAETDALKKTLRDNPLAMPHIVSSLAAGLGDDTPRALAEISEEAPVLAHVAGLQHATGSQKVAVEVAEALQLRAEKGYKSPLPPPSKLQSAFAEQAGTALSVLPGTGRAALETAAALTETRAMARGVSLDDFTAGSPARQIFDQAVDEVLGASWQDGEKFGGLTDVNGWETIAPPDIAADDVQDMIGNLSADDLIFQPSIGSANGVPIMPAQLRGGRLVMTSPGRYRIALGDVEAGRPDYVPDGAGGFFELDLGMLKRTQQDRGAFEPSANQRRRQTINEWGNSLPR